MSTEQPVQGPDVPQEIPAKLEATQSRERMVSHATHAVIALLLSIPAADSTGILPQGLQDFFYGRPLQIPQQIALDKDGNEVKTREGRYSDIPAGEWYEKHVQNLREKQVFQGPREDKEGQFFPATPTNRAELAKVTDLVRQVAENELEFSERKQHRNQLFMIIAIALLTLISWLRTASGRKD